MAKRISDVERITTYFQSADESAATVMLQVVKGILTARFGNAKPARKPRGPNKSKAAPGAPNGRDALEES